MTWFAFVVISVIVVGVFFLFRQIMQEDFERMARKENEWETKRRNECSKKYEELNYGVKDNYPSITVMELESNIVMYATSHHQHQKYMEKIMDKRRFCKPESDRVLLRGMETAKFVTYLASENGFDVRVEFLGEYNDDEHRHHGSREMVFAFFTSDNDQVPVGTYRPPWWYTERCRDSPDVNEGDPFELDLSDVYDDEYAVGVMMKMVKKFIPKKQISNAVVH